MSWPNESQKHSLASKGVRTKAYKPKTLGERFISIEGPDRQKVIKKIQKRTGFKPLYERDDKAYIPIPKGRADEVSDVAVEAAEDMNVIVFLRIPGGHYRIAGRKFLMDRRKKP